MQQISIILPVTNEVVETLVDTAVAIVAVVAVVEKAYVVVEAAVLGSSSLIPYYHHRAETSDFLETGDWTSVPPYCWMLTQ